MTEKIFIVGASGGIGSKLTRFLLKKNSDVTIYVRNVEKAQSLFPQSNNLKIVQGDYSTMDTFEREIPGHTRLFILVSADDSMPKIKGAFAKIAYAAGVRQIVDISSFTVNFPYRCGFISAVHRESEERILAEKARDDQFYVALRPGGFFSNHVWLNSQSIKARQSLDIIHEADFEEDFISTTDIAELASVVLTEPVEKHANCVYTMIGETLSANDRATIFSEAVGKPVKVNIVPMKGMYDHVISIGFPHSLAIDLLQKHHSGGATPYFSVMLGRPAQTFREWLQEDNNFEKFQ